MDRLESWYLTLYFNCQKYIGIKSFRGAFMSSLLLWLVSVCTLESEVCGSEERNNFWSIRFIYDWFDFWNHFFTSSLSYWSSVTACYKKKYWYRPSVCVFSIVISYRRKIGLTICQFMWIFKLTKVHAPHIIIIIKPCAGNQILGCAVFKYLEQV